MYDTTQGVTAYAQYHQRIISYCTGMPTLRISAFGVPPARRHTPLCHSHAAVCPYTTIGAQPIARPFAVSGGGRVSREMASSNCHVAERHNHMTTTATQTTTAAPTRVTGAPSPTWQARGRASSHPAPFSAHSSANSELNSPRLRRATSTTTSLIALTGAIASAWHCGA